MRRSPALAVLLGILVTAQVWLSAELGAVRGAMAEQTELAPPLPAAALKLLSLEYDNLVADLIFSRTLSFHGGKLHRNERSTPETWRIIVDRLGAASELDPRFVDPYYFAQSALTWEAGMPAEANRLLDRGMRARSDDWEIPFFMGFNAFYFLHDNASGSSYLMEASRRPGSPRWIGLLAARLGSKSGATETAVVFLEQLAARTEDEATRAEIIKRAEAMRGILTIERAVGRYYAGFGTMPTDLQALMDKGILDRLPGDPYGGRFYLNASGKVWTTSDLRPVSP